MLKQMLQSRMIGVLATHKEKEGEEYLSYGCMQYLGRKDAQRLTTLKEVCLRTTASTDWPGICLHMHDGADDHDADRCCWSSL